MVIMTATVFMSSRAEHSPISGMVLAAAAFALMTSVDTIFKLMVQGHPVYQLLLINGCFGLIPVVGWALLTGGFARFATPRPIQHLVRGSISVMSSFAAIYAYSRLPLTHFYSFVFTGPLIVTALSAFWLNEKIDRTRWLAIIAGFIGIVFVVNPFSDGTELHGISAITGRAAALVSVFCYALSVIMIRRMRLGESNLAFSWWGYVASLLICGTLWLIRGAPEIHTADVLRLVVSGFLSGIASICLLTAYYRSPVALVAPFQYTQIIWGAIAGWLFWAQVPSLHLLMGAAIVAASGLYVIYSETRARETS
jgi:drug/metabolite transporter (DMT)-like permease